MAICTISREYGAGGRDVGRLLADRLQYEYVDKERLFRDLERRGARWGRVARELDEVCPTLWERNDWQYQGYLALLESLILDYAAADRVVLIGRGASYLLQEVPYCLKVRLVAPLEVRVERVMLRESVNAEEARRLISRIDHDRACYIKTIYGRDWDADQDYDMVLNTGSLTYEQVTDLLAAGLADREPLATPEAKQRLKVLALASRLKARIATDPRVLLPTLEVKPEDGVIVVSGIIHTPKDQKILEELAAEILGSHPARFELQHRL